MILLKATFANADRMLWPGESVDVETQYGADRDAVLVPANAVQTGQDGSQVYVVKADHTVELRPVRVGRSAEGLTIVAIRDQGGRNRGDRRPAAAGARRARRGEAPGCPRRGGRRRRSRGRPAPSPDRARGPIA